MINLGDRLQDKSDFSILYFNLEEKYEKISRMRAKLLRRKKQRNN